MFQDEKAGEKKKETLEDIRKVLRRKSALQHSE